MRLLFRNILHSDSVCDILRSMVETSMSERELAKTFLMNAAVWMRLLPNALPMFQPKCIKSMLLSAESTYMGDTSRGVSPKLYSVM